MHTEAELPKTRARILAVDDTPATLAALCELLVEEHEVLFATSGAEALEMARCQQPDLVLLDVVMPGMDGYEVCTRLKADAQTADLPVLFVTSLGDEVDQARGFAAGAIDYVQKPFSPPLVKARVRNHLEQKRKQDVLRGLSAEDGLTGLANRRRFDAALREEWQRCARSHTPLSLIMIDIDHFKAYNDAYGHAAGDDCLRRVAVALRRAPQRPVDLVARYGGEEFVCLLPETDERGARQVAERARAEVAALALPHGRSATAPVVTLSQGVATFIPLADGHPESLLLEADSLLYEAKHGGRDRIAQAGAAAEAARAGGNGRQAAILLVEDDPLMRNLLSARLEPLGARLEVVRSAQEALSFLARERVDLILSDVVMPGMDGFVLCQRLKEDPARRGTPFVLLTSLTRNLRERSAQAGADDHLGKQEDDPVFRMRIRLLLEIGSREAGRGPVEASGGSVLLLSPAPLVRTQLAVHLQTTGIQVRAHGDLASASADAQRKAPDLVALDLAQDGVEANTLQRLCGGSGGGSGNGSIPCLALADKGEEGRLAALQEGIQDRLLKPLDAQDVRHRIGLLLRLARARRAGN